HPESLVPCASQRPAPAAPAGAGRGDAAMDDGTGARSRGRTGAGASARVAGRRRARHLVRPGARRAVAGPVAGVGHAVVGTRGAHQQPVGPLVETARMRALPVGGGDAARHRPGAPPVARRPSRRADRRRHHPDLRAPFTALATHRDPEVRSQVARALGKYPHGDSVAALRLLARDGIWPVRAQAIRSLGMIADPATVQLVRDALRDGDWWVRLRAGLALTRFGASGRNVLLAVEVGAHQPSRDMARLVLGLSPQALAEYAA